METATEQTPALTLEHVGALTVFKADSVDKILKATRENVMSLVIDVSTRKGREEEKSLAYQVSQAKAHVVKLANKSIEEHKAIVASVTAERLRLERGMDAIRDERKAASLEWEAKEEARKAEIQKRIELIAEQGKNLDGLTVDELTARINEAIRLQLGDFAEYADTAKRAAEYTQTRLVAASNARKKADADAAELAKLREIQAKREAEDAARAAKEAADKAEAERRAAELKAAQEAKERAERDAKEAEAREERRKLEQENAIKAAEEKAAQRERERIAAEQRQKEEAAKQEADAEAARKMAAELAEAKRKADETHRNKIRMAAHMALINVGVPAEPEDVSSRLLIAIERGEIPHVTINF